MEQVKIGKFIQMLRKEKALTQKELAEWVGVSDKTISKWENGNGMPDVSNMFVLCECFGITMNELLAGEKVSSEEYSKKAEENIMALLEKTNEAEKSRKIYLLIGIPLIVLGVLLLTISSFGISFGNAYYTYVDTCYMVVYALILVACACIFRAVKKVRMRKALKRFAFPVGAVISLSQVIYVFGQTESISALGLCLAIGLLPMFYGLLTHIVLLFADVE